MKKGREEKRGKSVSAHRVATEDTIVHGLTAMARTAGNTPNTNDWIIDSGATHHISPNLTDFQDYHPLEEFIEVESADSVSLATAAGSINLHLECGIHLRVEALYVPDFGALFLSVPQLIKEGIDVSFRSDSHTAYITSVGFTEQPPGRCTPGSMSFVLLGKAVSKPTSVTEYQANFPSCRTDSETTSRTDVDSSPQLDVDSSRMDSEPILACQSTGREDIETWHRRLGHLNFSDIRKLLPKGSYSEKETKRNTCDICIKAKAKEKFQRRIPARRVSKPLELIHSDLCGPISPASQSGRRYYILYIDDFSRYTWVCFLRGKSSSEVCTVFKDFKILVERQLKHRITRFRCDNGKGEYDNETFRAILTEYGITFEPSPVYTQHKNGVSERMIQTHNAKACAMLLDSTLPPSMWAEAISTANYLHARSPTSSNNGITLYEKLFGRKPEVSHLRNFRCKAYKTLPAIHRSKFGTRTDTLFMLGYVHDSTTIWRFWDPRRRQVIQASNITFVYSAQELEHGNTENGRGLVPNGLDTSDGPAVDTAACELSVSRESPDNIVGGREFVAPNRHGLDTSDGPAVDALAGGLGVSRGSLGNEGGCGFVTPSGLDDPNGRGLVQNGLADQNGRGLVPAETSSRYDLRKRPRVVAHQIRVEEEPMDSTDPVSYREAIEHPRLGQQWSDAVGEELRSLAENSTWDYVRLEDVPAGVISISSKWVFKTKELPGGGTQYKARLVI